MAPSTTLYRAYFRKLWCRPCKLFSALDVDRWGDSFVWSVSWTVWADKCLRLTWDINVISTVLHSFLRAYTFSYKHSVVSVWIGALTDDISKCFQIFDFNLYFFPVVNAMNFRCLWFFWLPVIGSLQNLIGFILMRGLCVAIDYRRATAIWYGQLDILQWNWMTPLIDKLVFVKELSACK